jgi:hypothetical protein
VTEWTYKDVAVAANGLLDASAATTFPTDGDRGARKPDLGTASGHREPQVPEELVDEIGIGLSNSSPSVFQVTGVDERRLTAMVLSQQWMLPVLHSLTWRIATPGGAAVANPARATTEKIMVEARTNILV